MLFVILREREREGVGGGGGGGGRVRWKCVLLLPSSCQ